MPRRNGNKAMQELKDTMMTKRMMTPNEMMMKPKKKSKKK